MDRLIHTAIQRKIMAHLALAARPSESPTKTPMQKAEGNQGLRISFLVTQVFVAKET